ncbi:FAD-binding oxidoreductase [Phytohabitans flavus]|uniref:FAD-binding oxidoreductase n=1 Tax=Phytohabitans flavus TaxID=1076124 RepID=UPI00362FA46C
MADWAALDGAITGMVLWPGRPGYDEARRPPIVRYREVRPAAVVLCATEEDVEAALNFAGAARLPVAVRSGGHCFAGRSSTTGVVLDVSPMDAVEIGDGTVTVGAGVRLGDLYDHLAPHGLTIPAGCGPTVGITGLTLGGGLGILGRTHGLTCDFLRAARVVVDAAAADGGPGHPDCAAAADAGRGEQDSAWAAIGEVGSGGTGYQQRPAAAAGESGLSRRAAGDGGGGPSPFRRWSVVECDAERHADLFWMLRGGERRAS